MRFGWPRARKGKVFMGSWEKKMRKEKVARSEASVLALPRICVHQGNEMVETGNSCRIEGEKQL